MSKLKDNDVTSPALYYSRRKIMTGMAVGAGVFSMMPRLGMAKAITNYKKAVTTVEGESLTPFKSVTTYNNFYEFGENKTDPSEYAPKYFKPDAANWRIQIEGECAKPGTVVLEDLLKPYEIEEHIYRHRCVEAWSMVIPWLGVPLHKILSRFEPNSKAKYVIFTTLHDPKQMPAQGRYSSIDWPYIEALRIDEAMHPLALLSTGLYGQDLLSQNGAPVRLVVPWKYGFKGIKSIVKIRFSETPVKTSWMKAGPNEYGFYSNVNPEVEHPRWSQESERRIGEFRRRPTLMFNGYGEQVASLYAGMDLKKNF